MQNKIHKGAVSRDDQLNRSDLKNFIVLLQFRSLDLFECFFLKLMIQSFKVFPKWFIILILYCLEFFGLLPFLTVLKRFLTFYRSEINGE